MRPLKFFSTCLWLCSCLCLLASLAHAQRLQRVTVPAKRYLITPTYSLKISRDTVIYLPEGSPYQIKRNPRPLMQRKYPRKVYDLFYRAEVSQDEDSTFTQKSEDAFVPYEGMHIRNIKIRELEVFGNSVLDTTRRAINWLERTGDRLHLTTRPWVLRENLFIREGESLNAYRVADNERLLRNLGFIQDARIFVQPVPGQRGVVDLEVVAKDVFSLGATPVLINENRGRLSVYDDNLLGMGQRLELMGIYDKERRPNDGYAFAYTKTNVMGSFINATVGYSHIDNAPKSTPDYEASFYVRLERPLFMPYTRVIGGADFRASWSLDVYQLDSNFRRFRYNVYDGWLGYTFGKQRDRSGFENRTRWLVAGRATRQYFLEQPSQAIEQDNPTYNNRTAYIGQVQLLRKDFYKTRYLLGFGRTEDLAYGFDYVLQAGLEQRLSKTRYYLGAEVGKSYVSSHKNYISYTLRAGAFWNSNRRVEDLVVNIRTFLYSKLLTSPVFKFRSFFSFNYTAVINRQFYGLVGVNNERGIRGFNTALLSGEQKIVLSTETTMWTRIRLLGFKFAFFAGADAAAIARSDESLLSQRMYTGFLGGLRIRNENLVFETIQLQARFYPRPPSDVPTYAFEISSNVALRSVISLFRAPGFVPFE